MGRTTFSGPVNIGTIKIGAGENQGTTLLSQKIYFVPSASIVTSTDTEGSTNTSSYNGELAVAWAGTATAVSGALALPANSNIVDIIFDQPTATTGGTAINTTVGITAGGTEYSPTTDVKAGGRIRPTFTATQLTGMQNIGANTAVYVQVTPTVTAVTAGVLSATILYTQV